LKKLAQHPKVVAIGEIGLDYYRNLSPKEQQKTAFVDQVAVAKELGLPIVIHNRDAFTDIFALLLETEAFDVGGVFHCFSGTVEEAQQTIDLGFHISVNGILTYKNATMAAVGAAMPLEKILLETDCPFLSPHPFRGKRNEPSYVAHIAEKLAEIRGTSLAEIDRVTDENAQRLFNLPAPHPTKPNHTETADS
jgi:TatD DNase family protein